MSFKNITYDGRKLAEYRISNKRFYRKFMDENHLKLDKYGHTIIIRNHRNSCRNY